MLDSVVAVQLLRPMSTGRNKPLLFTCERAAGEHVEIVCKFSSAECGRSGIVRETLAAVLAADLGLPVPEPFLVTLADGLLDAIAPVNPRVATAIEGSMVPTFGCKLLPPGFSIWAPARTLEDRHVNMAAEIFAFDALILNSDRRVANSNCQFDGSDFAIFDHELSLLTTGVGSLVPPPWVQGGIDFLLQGPAEHVLYRAVAGRDADLTRLKGAWSSLTTDRFHQYRETLPLAWGQDLAAADDAVQYLINLHEHLDAAFEEVGRVLQ